MVTIGKNIAKARIDKGMRQKALAVAVGITPKHMSAIEHDQVSPSVVTMWHIADALGVTLNDLVTREAVTHAA